MRCSGLNLLVKLHALNGSVVPAGVTVLLGICNWLTGKHLALLTDVVPRFKSFCEAPCLE
jgi:hypothetical protein